MCVCVCVCVCVVCVCVCPCYFKKKTCLLKMKSGNAAKIIVHREGGDDERAKG